MDKDLKRLISNKKLATIRVMDWIGTYNKGQICNILGISRQTLERRFNDHKWNFNELEIINEKMPLI